MEMSRFSYLIIDFLTNKRFFQDVEAIPFFGNLNGKLLHKFSAWLTTHFEYVCKNKENNQTYHNFPHEFPINPAAATMLRQAQQPCDSPTPYPQGLSYHGSRLLLFFLIANADILASRIANSGERGNWILQK